MNKAARKTTATSGAGCSKLPTLLSCERLLEFTLLHYLLHYIDPRWRKGATYKKRANKPARMEMRYSYYDGRKVGTKLLSNNCATVLSRVKTTSCFRSSKRFNSKWFFYYIVCMTAYSSCWIHLCISSCHFHFELNVASSSTYVNK